MLETKKEGKVLLNIPKINRVTKTASIKDAPVFYNPEMEFSRDISVSVLSVFMKSRKLLNGLDALAASGARGIRYAKECGLKMTINDLNPSGIRLVRKNIITNKVRRKCTATKKDASLLMREQNFGFIDIDPFGSPVQFIDSAAYSIWPKGLIAITATDTAPLSGTYPMTCLKKYGIRSMKTPFYSELGLRILISNIILSLAKHEKAFVPVLSYAKAHYFRVFGRIERQGKIKSLLNAFKMVSYKGQNCGPVYLGPIQDKKFVRAVRKDLAKRGFQLEKQELKLLDTLSKELDVPFYYDIHRLAKQGKIKLEKTDLIMKRLRKQGFKVSRTHFCPTAIKTDKIF
jgi:tRNA (guanine26-N2/guanine27-N2)-dimethyltransferase